MFTGKDYISENTTHLWSLKFISKQTNNYYINGRN